MLYYAIRRLLLSIPVLLIALTFAFFILRLAPGGPFDEERALDPVIRANLEAHYNMDKPLLTQYYMYMENLIFRGDMGPSFTDQTYNVREKLGQGLPYTVQLGVLALILSVVLGTWTGIYSAFHQNSKVEYILAFFILVGVVLPNFVLAPLFQQYLVIPLNKLASNIAGEKTQIFAISNWGEGKLISFKHGFIPVLVLSLSHIGRISRLMRASMIEVLGSNYIRTAKAKGIGEKLTIRRHALRQAFIPVLSYLGPAAGYLLTGSLVVEMIFGLPGIGKYFIDAALNRDYGVVLGTIILFMVMITILNLIVDILYAFLDPRVRLK